MAPSTRYCWEGSRKSYVRCLLDFHKITITRSLKLYFIQDYISLVKIFLQMIISFYFRIKKIYILLAYKINVKQLLFFRFKYKDEYEKFKLILSAIGFLLSLANLCINLR